jgi:anti-sigma-K factor RskA
MRTDDGLRREVAAHRDVAATIAAGAPMTPSPMVRGQLLSAVRRERRLPPWVTVALAASLLVAAGLASYAVRLRDQLAARERSLNTLLEAERGLRVAHLVGEGGATGPGIQFFWNERQSRALAHVFRLPPATVGMTYQIWAIVDGKPVSIALFDSDPDGHALVEQFTLPVSAAGVSAVAVTVEPEGGSTQPTSTPFLVGSIVN